VEIGWPCLKDIGYIALLSELSEIREFCRLLCLILCREQNGEERCHCSGCPRGTVPISPKSDILTALERGLRGRISGVSSTLAPRQKASARSTRCKLYNRVTVTIGHAYSRRSRCRRFSQVLSCQSSVSLHSNFFGNVAQS
jgi:hypothetical protein